jgi:hypothetical protein
MSCNPYKLIGGLNPLILAFISWIIPLSAAVGGGSEDIRDGLQQSYSKRSTSVRPLDACSCTAKRIRLPSGVNDRPAKRVGSCFRA